MKIVSRRWQGTQEHRTELHVLPRVADRVQDAKRAARVADRLVRVVHRVGDVLSDSADLFLLLRRERFCLRATNSPRSSDTTPATADLPTQRKAAPRTRSSHGKSSTTASTGVGTSSSAHSSVLSTSQKQKARVGKPSRATYAFITAGFDSSGNQRLRWRRKAAAASELLVALMLCSLLLCV